MAISYRDIKLKSDKRLDKKQDKRQQFRAVITDSFGNQSGAGDIWFSRTQRKVWAMKVGGTQPYPYYCYRIKPAIGVGVIIGYSSPLNQLPEVLQTDTEFLGPSNTTGTAYESPDNEDFLPGGRLQLWLDTRLIQSLAIYPDATGLFVNVTNGDYIYAGERKTFDGEENIDLSASQPGAGLHRYVGLYLDSSNLLQTVDGATVVLASTPAQPTWPDGSYRLGMVRINSTQTSFSMADDIVNLKIPWTDEESFGTGVWPADGEIKINDTLYTTLALAIAAAVSGDIIRLGSGTFTCNNLTLPNGVSLIGSDMTLTILSQTADANCLTTGTTGDVSNLKISMLINSANDRVALVLLGDNFIENVYVTGDNAGVGKVDGVSSTSSNDPVLTDCIVGVGSGGYAVVLNNVNTIVTLNMGNYFGGTGSVLVTNGLCKLIYPQLQSAPTAYPATQGIWFDAGGTPQTQLQGKAVWFNSSTTSPLNVTPRATAPSSPVASDAYIDDGTNTGSGTPAWREYISGAWRTLTLADMVTTAGDIIYATAAKTVARLGIGLDGTFLKVVTGLPAWTALAASDIASGVLAIARGGTNSGTALNNNRVMQSSTGAIVEAAAITAARALVSDANGIPVAATTTTTEINFVNGVTSAIQTQLDARIAKAFLDAKGDLITATANDTPAILSAGTDGKEVAYLAASTNGILGMYPTGIDYTIAVSVATNDLTVALKTLGGNDASASDPIRVRIGDTLQVITAALSTTKNDGTNWCNSGGNELKTLDVDYFCYLIQETGASAGTKIGFSRIPWATVMGDFSGTSTNETYIAGNWTNKNATDAVALIGRFNAILSGTAAFNWSLTTQVIINRPILETRWLTYTPALTSQLGVFTTTGAVAGAYQVSYNKLFFNQSGTITTNGTGAGSVQLSLPFTPQTDYSVVPGRENALTGSMLQGRTSAALVQWFTYNNAYPGGDGAQIHGGGIAFRLI